MKICLLIILTLFCEALFAQSTKKTNTDRHLNIREEYYVSDKNTDVKEGTYVARAFYGDWLKVEGFYRNNQKDSLWKYYNYLKDTSKTGYSRYISKTGFYKSDEKTGIWDVYDTKGARELQYDYTTKKLLFYKNNPENKMQKYSVINGQDTLKTTLDRPPLYQEGIGSMFQLIGSHLKYPTKALEKNIQGKVMVAFTVDTLGKMSNFNIKSGVGFGLDDEALRVVKLLDGDWLPGMLNGKLVSVEYFLPVSFSIQRH